MRQRKYSVGTLRTAVAKVRDGSVSAYKAHKEYGVPKSTLSVKIRNQHSKIYGKVSILSADLEQQLADWIILCATSGNPRTSLEIREAATGLASLVGKAFKKGLPTLGWLQKFLKRHPEIAKRTPETLSKASAGVTRGRLERYFELLYTQFESKGMLDLLHRPEAWWNADESGFALNPVPKNVYAKKGAKVVYNVERGKPKDNITCTYAVAADGRTIPPLITFKETFSDLVEVATASGSVGANFGFNTTASGWVRGDAFYYFVTQHLNPRWIEMKLPRPIVLVVDGYTGHNSLKLFKWCVENNVVLVILYPNATHIIQVLDVAVFSPLKAKYNDYFQNWKDQNPGKMFNEVEFVKLLKKTNDAAINAKTIINGWKSTGLQPFCFDNIKTNKFLTGLPEDDNENRDQGLSSPEAVFPTEHTLSASLNTYDETDISIGMETFNIPFDVDSQISQLVISSCDNSSLSNDCTGQIELSSTRMDSSELVQDSQPKCGSLSIESVPSTSNNTSDVSSVDHQTIRLILKVREELNRLRDHLDVHEHSKLINVIIMEQQLNIIEPILPGIVEPASVPVSRTTADILKIPKAVTKMKRKKKGMKISFGVMSDKQVIEEMEQREAVEKNILKERQNDEFAKAEKSKLLKEAREELAKEADKLKAARQHIKSLEAEAAAERKRVAAKRKSQKENAPKTKQLIKPISEPSCTSGKMIVI